MGWLLAFQQCEKHWETTRSKWNGLHPRNGEALAQKMMRWQKCRCCSVHLWRLGMVGGKLNQTPKSLNSTGKRELLEILRIWILQVLDLRQKDLQTVAFGKFMKGLSGLPRKKKHFGVSCRSEIWSIHCCSHCWGMKDCESMSLAMQRVKKRGLQNTESS